METVIKPKSGMEFPEERKIKVDETFSWAEVKALLDKEFMRRAEYVARIITALREEYGDGVMDVVRNVIYEIGYEKGKMRAALAQGRNETNDLENLASQVAHKISKLYFGTSSTLAEGELTIREEYCPMPRKWKEMGFPDDEIVDLCLILDQVDKGMVEGFNPEFTAELSGCRTLAEKGYCQMVVSRKR